MFTVYLTPEKYYFNLLAAKADPSLGPGYLHITYEQEPNLKVGDEVEVVVRSGDGKELRQIGEVAAIRVPPEKSTPIERLKQAASEAAMREQFMRQFGVDPRTFPKDQHHEDNIKSQWYVMLRRKTAVEQ